MNALLSQLTDIVGYILIIIAGLFVAVVLVFGMGVVTGFFLAGCFEARRWWRLRRFDRVDRQLHQEANRGAELLAVERSHRSFE